jgi:hypothetical protein
MCTPEIEEMPAQTFAQVNAHLTVAGDFQASTQGDGVIRLFSTSEMVDDEEVFSSTLNLYADDINLVGNVLVNGQTLGSGGLIPSDLTLNRLAFQTAEQNIQPFEFTP